MRYDPSPDLRLILAHQHADGAYVASPGYSQYPYCWLRDGSFIAHAMDAADASASASRFHVWTARAIAGVTPEIRAAIAARRAGEPVDHTRMPLARYEETAGVAWRFVLDRCVTDRRFGKCVRNDSVDASLLWLSTPFGLVADDAPVFRRTLEGIEDRLVADGGVLRYPEDTFYGGGAWILLTAWLAWHHARNGRPGRAAPYLSWIERQRSTDGGLPEPVPVSATDPWFHGYWTERWGPSARPLLWSHAMTILAHR